MVVVFVLGLCVSALMERRAEVASIFNNRKTVIKGIEARNELFKDDFPREYQTWTETAKTDFQSEFNFFSISILILFHYFLSIFCSQSGTGDSG